MKPQYMGNKIPESFDDDWFVVRNKVLTNISRMQIKVGLKYQLKTVPMINKTRKHQPVS